MIEHSYLTGLFDRRTRLLRILGPGAVIQPLGFLTQRFEREGQNSRGDAGTAAGNDRFIEVDAGRGECLRNLVARDETAVFKKPVVGDIERARHMAGVQAGTWLRSLAGKSFGRARVDDLDALLQALRDEGCNVLEKTDDSDYGKFGWVMDPEDNKVELWQPPPGM